MNKSEREQSVRQDLMEIATMLEGVAESHWSAKARAVASTSTIDLDELLSWYGGMGSFNDLLIARVNGHHAETAQERPINEKLDELRTRVFAAVSALRIC